MNSTILNDRYEIVQQLGKRAGRETLLVRDLSTQELAVIKLLKFSSEFEWEDFKLFEREAQTLQNLSHPQIPQYLNFFEFELAECKGFALVQTYIEAKSFAHHRQAGRTFSESEVKQIAEQLLEILSYLHDRHPPVIHRDLKPSNILLGDRSGHYVGKVYLVDFGSVQNVAAVEGGTFTVVGTYGYMPPEQFGGRTVPASDLYSLGATLIYLMTGQHPADLPQKNLQIQIKQVAKLSPSFECWLEKLLEPSLDRRFNSSQAALKALQNPETTITRSDRPGAPVGSQIQISRGSEALSIFLPRNKLDFSKSKKYNTLFPTGEMGCGCFLIIAILPFFNLLLGGIISLSLSLLVLWYMCSKLDNQLMTEIIISKTDFVVVEGTLEPRELFSIIDTIKLEKTIYFVTKTFDPSGVTEKTFEPSIVIWAGTTPYIIKDLTEPEADWLGAELSSWLVLPLERRNIPIINS